MTDEQYDLLEKEIARLQNENYANPDALALMDWEASLVLADYYGEVVDGIIVDDNLWLDE